MRSKLAAVLFAFAVFIQTVTVAAYGYDRAEILDGIISFKLSEGGYEDVQSWIDGSLAENAGTGSEWYVIALSRCGEYDFAAYRTALEEYLSDREIKSAVTRQKYALALIAADSDSDYISETAGNSMGEQGLMSRIFGLHLLNNGCVNPDYTAEDVAGKILSLQLADGGWAVMGDYGDVDVTAMAVQALAPYYGDDSEVSRGIDRAVEFLSEKQLENGGFSSMGKENSESVSQVITALAAVEIDPFTDSRFIKDGNLSDALAAFRLADGSFCHEAGGEKNEISTAQAMCAMTAAECGNLYIFGGNSIAEESSTETTEYATEISVTEGESAENETPEKKSYKPAACLIAVGVGVCLCVVLWILKKRNAKNFIAAGILTAAAVCVIVFTDFSYAEDYYGSDFYKENPVGTVTMTIRCDTVAGEDSDYIPADGIILPETEFVIAEGETAYDILVEACRKNNIHMENSGGASAYISGIGYLYEFDFGDLSGWLYRVNGETKSVGCDSFILSDGDRIEWLYTLEMGNDL